MKQIYLTVLVGFLLLPTFLFSQNLSISGIVTRHNGIPVPDIEVSCFDTVITNFEGLYEILDVPINTSCEFTLKGTFDKFEDITVLDAVSLRQHILQESVLDLLQILAGDLNSSNGITTIDIVRVIELALQKDVLIDTNYEFRNTSSPGTVSFGVIITDTLENINFTAIKRGDVAISSDHIPAPPEAPTPIFTINSSGFLAGETVKIEVDVQNFVDIGGVQNTFSWDPTILQFESITDFQDLAVQHNTAFLDQGQLPVVKGGIWNNLSGETLYRLNFTALADSQIGITPVKMTDEIIQRQVVWENPVNKLLFIVEGEYKENITEPVSINTLPSSLRSFDVFPNPVKEQLNVNVLLQESTDFEISIVNVLGQVVFSEQFKTKELLEIVDVSGLVGGTYFLSLRTDDGVVTEVFVKE